MQFVISSSAAVLSMTTALAMDQLSLFVLLWKYFCSAKPLPFGRLKNKTEETHPNAKEHIIINVYCGKWWKTIEREAAKMERDKHFETLPALRSVIRTVCLRIERPNANDKQANLLLTVMCVFYIEISNESSVYSAGIVTLTMSLKHLSNCIRKEIYKKNITVQDCISSGYESKLIWFRRIVLIMCETGTAWTVATNDKLHSWLLCMTKKKKIRYSRCEAAETVFRCDK